MSVSIWIPLSVSFRSQIVWHFGGWSAWAPSPLLPAPIWPWAQATWCWLSAWPPAHPLWPQLPGWHRYQEELLRGLALPQFCSWAEVEDSQMERAHSAWGTNANIHSLMVEGVSVLWGAVLRCKAISPHRRTFLVCVWAEGSVGTTQQRLL